MRPSKPSKHLDDARVLVLLRKAKEHEVQVHFVAAHGLDWLGLYLFHPRVGAGIALRPDLSLDWLVWVLAHELGHHFAAQEYSLFGPFEFAAHRFPVPRVGPKKASPSEELADRWAALTLISKAHWFAAETKHPLCLSKVASELQLPLQAAVAWDKNYLETVRPTKVVQCNPSIPTLRMLKSATVGKGGHQSFFSRVTKHARGRRLSISFQDFSIARRRAATAEGGWLARYEALLECVSEPLAAAGSVKELFGIPE